MILGLLGPVNTMMKREWIYHHLFFRYMSEKEGMFWPKLPGTPLRLHFRLKLTYFRAILGDFGSFIQVIWLYGSFIRVFQTFFKRAFGLSWILIPQNLFSESKVRAVNSLIVFLSFYWHLRILWITDSTVSWDFRLKIVHFWSFLAKIGSKFPIFGIKFGLIFLEWKFSCCKIFVDQHFWSRNFREIIFQFFILGSELMNVMQDDPSEIVQRGCQITVFPGV